MEPKFIQFSIDGYDALSIYDYTDYIKNLVYLYKGCFDYEMREAFLNLFLPERPINYKGYKLVPKSPENYTTAELLEMVGYASTNQAGVLKPIIGIVKCMV